MKNKYNSFFCACRNIWQRVGGKLLLLYRDVVQNIYILVLLLINYNTYILIIYYYIFSNKLSQVSICMNNITMYVDIYDKSLGGKFLLLYRNLVNNIYILLLLLISYTTYILIKYYFFSSTNMSKVWICMVQLIQ